MSNIDDLFREGLGDRKPEVPRELWSKIMANKAAIPEGEALDQLFANGLRDRQAEVPGGMWARIVAARRPANYRVYAAVLLLLLLSIAGGIAYVGVEEAGPGTLVQELAPESQPQRPGSVAREPSGVRDEQSATGTNEDFKSLGSVQEQGTLSNPDAGKTDDVGMVIDRSRAPATTAPIRTTNRLSTPSISTLEVIATLPLPGPVKVAPEATFLSGRKAIRGEALFGAAYAHQMLQLGAEGSQLLREAREVSEFPEVSFQLTARVHYPLRGGFGLIGGLTYAEIRNQLEYERPAVGGPELVRSNNRIRMLEVPLLLSYQIPGNKLRLSVNAGPIVNLTNGVSGRFLDPALALPLDLKQNGGYRSNIGLGWTTSLTTTYLVGKSRTTELLLEPFFKSYPGSFTRPDARLSEKYWVAGLQLGIRKQLR